MGGKTTRLGLATALALAAAIGVSASGSAAAPVGVDPVRDLAIVEVATPELPAGDGVAARQRWHTRRAHSNRILERVADRNGLAIGGRIPETGQLTVLLEDRSVPELRSALASDPRVRAVYANEPIELRYAPNDFAFAQADSHAPSGDVFQWHLHQSLAPAAWDRSKGNGGEVAVVDSGADAGNPDLVGRIAARLDCTSFGCSGTGITDTSGHGTHVSGLACADSDNVVGIASLGFDCGLYVIRTALDCAAVGHAIVAAANHGSDAINLSLGGCGPSLNQEIGHAWASGSVPVAAGTNCPVPNGSTPTCHAPSQNHPAQSVQPEGSGQSLSSGRGLVVTAAKHGGSRASFAQMTSGVSVAAFGAATDSISAGQQGILSTWPSSVSCSCRITLSGATYAYLVGTSMAAPQVAGLVALMRDVDPSLSNSNLVRLVKTTATNCNGYGAGGLGWGLIRADRAVAAAAGKDPSAPRSKLRRGRRGKLRVKSSDKSDQECPGDVAASGVKRVRIFASRNGKRYRRIGKTKTKTNSFPFRPKRKGRYRFYSIAVDKAGNAEAAPAPTDPDTKFRVKRIRRRR